jgi:UDP-N-acetylglucosamine--N-acetylmuramyl-(pentapeptide) pyrophosphoryl-undecaprenol N-acetylglucosamine transferase
MSLSLKPYRFVISGGGTGGHIYPAISIANALMKMNAENNVLFVGANGRMEMDLVPKSGFEIIGLDVAGYDRKKKLNNLGLPFKVIKSLYQSLRILIKNKPDAVIGVGGYASGPLVMAAQLISIPTFLQEQNSHPGVTNRILARKVKKAFTAYDGLEKWFAPNKTMKTGNPVRQDIRYTEKTKTEALEYFGLNTTKKTILIIGGSLGAGSLNKVLENNFVKLTDAGYNVMWQCGRYYYDDLAKKLINIIPANMLLLPFVERMDLAYKASDIIVSRAGAGSISEFAIIGKPVILVPSPNVTDDHQTSNAKALEKVGAAILVKDAEVGKELMPAIVELINNDEQQKSMTENIKKLDTGDAAMIIAQEIYKFLDR